MKQDTKRETEEQNVKKRTQNVKHKDKERVMKGHRKLNSNTQNVKQKDTERETKGHRT